MIIRSRAPLRLGLGGGGTDIAAFSDLYGGHVLNATISLFAYATLQVTDDDQVEFVATDRGQRWSGAAGSWIEPTGPLALHKAVYNRIVREHCGGKPLSLRLSTYADAPAGSGLGTSSSVVVSMVKAYDEYLKLALGEYDLAHLAFEIERLDLRLSGGKQDHYAATFGGFNFMEFGKDDRVVVNPLRVKDSIVSELESSLVLYFSGVSRDSATIIDQQINNVSQGNQKSIEALMQLKSDAMSLKEALLRGQLQLFADILGKSWEAKKKTAAMTTNSNLDQVYEAAMNAGAYSGKVSGAGGGGFMMFLCDPCRRVELTQRLEQEGGRILNAQFTSRPSHSWRVD